MFFPLVLLVVFPPWVSSRSPLPRFKGVLRRRHSGRGRGFIGVATSHDCPASELALHFTWPFLTDDERQLLCSTFPIIGAYARLRYFASSRAPSDWRSLSSMGPIKEASPSLSRGRAYLLAAALLVLDFSVGDLLRWMGGVYTHAHINLGPIKRAVDEARSYPPSPGAPVVDFDRALHVLEHGAPIRASYVCRRIDVLQRNVYDNHASIGDEADAVFAKIVSECNNHFLIALPRWTWRFIYGVFLSPIGFVLRKSKGRVVVDPSTHVLSEDDSGALNDHMNANAADDVPPTYYATAQTRHWRHIWNLRISHPRTDILLYKDDINSAFHRVRYHPDIAAAFAYVWGDWLIISVGVIFGARNSPGWFCLISELRAHLAAVSPSLPSSPLLPLVRRISIPAAPSRAVTRTFAQAQADAVNPGTASTALVPTHHATFVDDNLMAEVHHRIQLSIQRSSASCYLLFGHPRKDLTPSLSEEKFVPSASHTMEQLGLDIDTRSMRVIYPLPKRTALLSLIDDGWSAGSPKSQRQIATLLGHLRTAATILPLGSYFSIRLQQWLTSCLRATIADASAELPRTERVRTAWRSRRCFFIPAFVARDLAFVRQTLCCSSAAEIWSRPLGLLVPRSPHAVSLTDASYEGLGGWCEAFPMQWRLSSTDLASQGWPVLTKEPQRFASFPATKLHINVLEFVAVFIQTWFILQLSASRSPPPGGWVFHFRSDNTSALGWMSHASRTRRSTIQNLARAYAALLTFVMPSRFVVTSSHISGKDNVEADALSRPLQFPSLLDTQALCPRLHGLPLYRVPSALLSHLFWVVSNPVTGEQLESATLALQQIEPRTSRIGVKQKDSPTPLSSSPPPKKRARSSLLTPKK